MSDIREIILVRHPETVANVERRLCGVTASPLTPRGQRQAIALADAIIARRPAVVYTSPSERTRAIASLVDPDGAFTVVLEEAHEVDFGQAEGYTLDEVAERGIALDYSGGGPVAPGGEHGAAFYARVSRAATMIIGGVSPAVVVTHGGVLRLLLSHMLELPTEVAWRIELPNAVMAVVRVTDGFGVLTELVRSSE